MYSMTVSEVIECTKGTLLCGDADTVITNICFDSREVKPGDLFVPLEGAKIDGHRFIESALEKAAATLTMRHSGVVIAEKPYIQVDDTLRAMQEIGAYIRNKFTCPIIGVTGSVGKTTTREMIATALSPNANVYQTIKNYNSQIGLPVTLFRMPEDTDCAVIEMGMSEKGEMERLSEMARPDICVITKIGVAHIENIGSREGIRKEKFDITSHMNEGGILFLNGDDDLLKEMKGRTLCETRFFGTAAWCEYRAENVKIRDDFMYEYDYVHDDTRIHVKLNALGRHNVINSLVGMAIADYLNRDLEAAAKAYEGFSGMRQKLIRIPGKYSIIDDTYNASPDSMRAAIDVLDSIEVEGKKLIVLGDMLELGEDSARYHYEVGEYLAGKKIDELIVVGELAQQIKKAVEDKNSHVKCYSFKDNGEVVLYLMSVMAPEDIVLLKASNGMHLSEIVSNMCG